MNEKQILDAVKSLSMSKGFYGRLLEQLQENGNALHFLAEQKFSGVLDLVEFLEC